MNSRIAIVTEAVYAPAADGTFVSVDGVNGDSQWHRYTSALPFISVIGRCRPDPAEGAPLVDHPLVPLEPYSGVAGLVRAARRLTIQLWRAMDDFDLLILRLPGPLSTAAAIIAQIRGRPYVAEVVGDASEVLRSGAVGRVGRLIAPIVALVTRRVVSRACAVRYVTQYTLQERYPAGRQVPQVAVPNVQLATHDFVMHARTRVRGSNLRLLAVGSQETSYKGHDIALFALRRLLDRGHKASLVLVGSGRTQPSLQRLAARLSLEKDAVFLGHVSRERITTLLAEADLLLHPSRTEGLPRVVLEASAQGVPVVATCVGGLPEIVRAEGLVRPNDPDALANAVLALSDPKSYSASSSWGLQVARSFNSAACELLFREWTSIVAQVAKEVA